MQTPVQRYKKRIEKLFAAGRPKTYSKNQLIHYQGDPLSSIYMIEDGYVKAYTILDSGDTRTILILGPGDVFPLALSVGLDWEGLQIRYFYQTLCDTKLQAIPADELKELISSDAKKMATYLNYITASNEAILQQLEVMKNKKAIDKVALLLPYLVDKAGRQIRPGEYQLKIKLSHQELADLSGVTRETTTTLIKQLEKEGVIDQRRGKWLIKIKNLKVSLPSD